MSNTAGDMGELLETHSVSTERYTARMDGGIYERYEDVPGAYRSRLEQGDDGTGTYDHVGMLMRGKDWVVAPLGRLQPHSYLAFQEVVGSLLLGIVLIKDLMNPDGPPLETPILFFDANGRMVQVQACFAGSTYEEGNNSFGSLLRLPDALAKSWLWRTNGWRLPSEPFQGPLINRRLIGHPSDQWKPVEDILKTFNPKRLKWLMNGILSRFPDAVVTRHNPHDGSPYQWTSMRCFLGTRPPGVNGPVGDQFFVFDQKRDQAVYRIRNGNLDDIRTCATQPTPLISTAHMC